METQIARSILGLNNDKAIRGDVLFVGALSFEDRATAAFKELMDSGASVARAVVLDYQTTLVDADEGYKMRESNWKAFCEIAGDEEPTILEKVPLNPYSYDDAVALVERELMNNPQSTIIVDLSCITKIHALALGFALEGLQSTQRVISSYTVPFSYNFSSYAGCPDVIVAPVSKNRALRNERFSRGIVLPGHEGDRLIMALSEIEPANGIVLYQELGHRPDVSAEAVRRNQQLLKMQSRSSHWVNSTISLLNIVGIHEAVGEETRMAMERGAPVFVYPMGSKVAIFEVGRALRKLPQANAWFVYPKPLHYDVYVTTGVDEIYWFEIRP